MINTFKINGRTSPRLKRYAMNKISLQDRCYHYWKRDLNALAESTNCLLMLEQANLNLNGTV